jgi:hypothetical protein
MPDSGLIHCFRGAALHMRAPGAPRPRRKKSRERFGAQWASMPLCRQCGRRTACLREVCDRCLKGVAR